MRLFTVKGSKFVSYSLVTDWFKVKTGSILLSISFDIFSAAIIFILFSYVVYR